MDRDFKNIYIKYIFLICVWLLFLLYVQYLNLFIWWVVGKKKKKKQLWATVICFRMRSTSTTAWYDIATETRWAEICMGARAELVLL